MLPSLPMMARALVVVGFAVGVGGVTDPTQVQALQQLYDSTWPMKVNTCCKTSGKNCPACAWKSYSNWGTGDPCDNNWQGVTCRSCPACTVVGLDMDDNWMLGKIPDGWLAKLPDLETLDIDYNGITGTFPDELETVPKLKNLQLGGSHTGSLPDFWTKHPETYEILHFHGGGFDGDHPTLTPMTALREYFLLGTSVEGSLPSFDTLTQMVTLRINNNDDLTGTIPVFSTGPTGQFTQLREMQISDNNKLSGTIPPFTDMTQAEYVRIDEMGLVTGTIPPVVTMTRLQRFDTSHNQLIGTVPAFAPENRYTLQYINVEENFLKGIPALDMNPTTLDALREIVFHHNLVTGTLPCHQTAYPLLEKLHGWNNRLTGTLPCLENLLQISEYQLQYNDFTGTLPDLTSGPGIKKLTLDNNMLSGTIPTGFVNGIVQVNELHLGANGFSGTIPDMIYLAEMTSLHLHRNLGYQELTPVSITSVGSMGGDATLQAARDGDATTDWECLPGSGDVCNIIVDFGRPVCLENVRFQESETVLPTNGSIRENIAPVMGCPTAMRIYQGSSSFSYAGIKEPMVRRWNTNLDSRNGNHNYNWQTCSPSSWRNIGRERMTNEESGCGANSGGQGTGGGWDPYCRDRTQYYKINIEKCSTVPCKVSEIKFYEASTRLSGTLPQMPPDLNTLWAYGNQLTGTIPLAGSNWDGQLLLSDNWLEGPLQDFCPALGLLDKLWIDHNKITGTLPGNQNCLGQVTEMRVGHNMLTGTIPPCACGQLQEYLLDGNACCQKTPTTPGHESWRDEALTSIESIGYYTSCPRWDCPNGIQGTGLEGPLPDFVTMPNLQRFGADNNILRGPLNTSLSALIDMKWFRVKHNKVAGTLPYEAIIDVGNRTANCNEQSWYFSNNTLWGPVPDLPGPLGTCSSYTGCIGWRDGRKMHDLYIDYNHLWGPLPTRFERVRADTVVNHNCWDCPIKDQAYFGPPLGPDPPRNAGYKELTRPPDCAEGPITAQRYELDGPSCPAEATNSLYEYVDRCRPEMNITARFTEEQIREGGLSFTISFADDSFLPFFAPGMWRCLLCEDAQGEKEDCSTTNCPWGPVDPVTGTAPCPIENPITASCPADVPFVAWPFGASTCPVGVNASCPQKCEPSTSACTTTGITCPMGECPVDVPCELNSVCPFGTEGQYYNSTSGACEIISDIVHAPNGTCQIGDTGACPPGECNHPWSCDPAVLATGTPWGPLPINFSIALKQLFFDGMWTDAQQQNQATYRAFYEHREVLMPLLNFALGPSPGSDPYVDLPTELIVTLDKAPLYDTSVVEPIGVTVWDELLVAPFGTLRKPAGYWYIEPSPGVMSGDDVRVLEEVVRGFDSNNKPVGDKLVVKVTLPENDQEGGWETFRCKENYTEACPVFATIVPPPSAPRTCDFECASEGYVNIPSIVPVQCSDYSMTFEITLPDYAITDYAQEVVEMEITGNCTASGLPPLNNTLRIVINSTFDPPPTMTQTITEPITDTVTLTNTYSGTSTGSRTISATVTAVPFCYLYPESALCDEALVVWWMPWLLGVLACLVGLCIAVLMYVICPKPRPIEVSVSKPECTVDRPVTVGVKKVPEAEVVIGVNKVVQDDVTVSVTAVRSNDIQIGVKKVATGNIMVNVSKERGSTSVDGGSLFTGSSTASIADRDMLTRSLLQGNTNETVLL